MAIGRPNADVNNSGGWTDQSGGSFAIYTSIDEPIPPNLSDWIQALSLPVGGAADLPYTAGLSAPSALGSGESYLMSCYADAAFATGVARHIRWELLEGVAVLETVVIDVTPSAVLNYTNIVTATIGDLSNLRYRWTLLHDGTNWQSNVYQAELRIIFPHLAQPSASPCDAVVSAGGGGYLLASSTSPIPITVAGTESAGSLVLDSPIPRTHE